MYDAGLYDPEDEEDEVGISICLITTFFFVTML